MFAVVNYITNNACQAIKTTRKTRKKNEGRLVNIFVT